jgi:hypothetical protein
MKEMGAKSLPPHAIHGYQVEELGRAKSIDSIKGYTDSVFVEVFGDDARTKEIFQCKIFKIGGKYVQLALCKS